MDLKESHNSIINFERNIASNFNLGILFHKQLFIILCNFRVNHQFYHSYFPNSS